ncbi:hypothetical protein EPUL_005046 [Erysiphe pulchra]|uniref:PSP1 C-terminal domain-containing protein n=1 Tax=Erysiphe pulchra TaxID=225359 RepID=A0A2S4PRP3_9PEZI|nr:hypothetical protein EPUL_005046 [Erysiphe pulchra]
MNLNEKSDKEREMDSTVEVSQNNTSMLGQKPEKRQSTPDSEALISSDDEGDRAEPHWYTQINQKSIPNANRYNETKLNLRHTRKASFASSSLSPTNSNLSTPSTDAGIWAHQNQGSSSISRGHPGPSKFAWSNGIWNTDTRIEPPPRLTEVFLTSDPSGSLKIASNGANKDQLANPTIPFPIPLHPTPKTYRSQSYSVGQLDPESPASVRPHIILGSGSRGRMFQHIGLQHRPSRPSMLSEMSNEGILGNVNEVDDYDNDERKENVIHRIPLMSDKAQTFEFLSRERGSLQQHQASFRSRSVVSSDNLFSNNLSDAFLDELDSAIEEPDDANENQTDSSLKEVHGRRFSEISFNNIRLEKNGPIENRKLENVKKAFWQSSLGFDGLGDVSQSRRHSFAEIPTHHMAKGSKFEQKSLQENAFQEIKQTKEYQNKYPEQKVNSFHENNISYYDGKSTFSNSLGNITYHQSARSCTTQTHYRGARSGSPHNMMYNPSQLRQNQNLTIVIFKFSRPDVFYIQEGTGLSVNPGDKVIVEADRGTDLGTVARTNIDWATAKEIRDYYSKEHYTWLSVNSRTRQRPPESDGAIISTSSKNFQEGITRALDFSGQHSIQESNSSDLKPKLIKRHAQKHEVDALREKEASEAKAKHVCAQKVQEHGLNMDILDAEFQMDLKKLTFYYFADSYINFNSLVTDLFKIYKTRIWMFAINPASFPSPSLGLQSPIPIGLGITSGMLKPAQYSPISEQMKSPCSLQASRALQNSYSQQLTPPLDRSFNSFTTPQFMYGLPSYSSVSSRNLAVPSSSIVNIDPLTEFTPQSDFRRHPAHFSSQNITLSSPQSNFRQGLEFNQNEAWIKSFHGLSMNSQITSDSESEFRQNLSKTSIPKTNQIEYDNDNDNDSDSDSLFVNDFLKSKIVKGKEIIKEIKTAQENLAKDDVDNDENHTESQSFLAMVVKQNERNKQVTKATKEFLRNFTRNVGESTNNLKDHIQHLNHISVKRESDFLFSFRTAFKISRSPQLRHDSKEESSFASLQEYSQDLIDKAKRTLELFESVNRTIISTEVEAVEMNLKWDEELSETVDLLRLGRQVGIERYNAMIQGDKMKMERNGLIKNKSSPSSDPTFVDSLLYDSDKNSFHDGLSWGTVAQKQLRALKKLVKVNSWV